MRSRLARRPEVADWIVPKNFAVGCRRPTPGNGYLEALCSENTEVVSQFIAEITPRGIKTTDGVEHEVDVIVCATGFDVSWRPSYPTIGREGCSLSEQWKDIPRTYLSITVPNFPNYLSKCALCRSLCLRLRNANQHSLQRSFWPVWPRKLPPNHRNPVPSLSPDFRENVFRGRHIF